EAQTRAEALLGMRPRGENRFDDLGGSLARFRRPENEPLGCPCGIVLVRLGHVGRHRAVAALVGGAVMAGHTHQAKQTVGKPLWHYVVATANRVPQRGASP